MVYGEIEREREQEKQKWNVVSKSDGGREKNMRKECHTSESLRLFKQGFLMSALMAYSAQTVTEQCSLASKKIWEINTFVMPEIFVVAEQQSILNGCQSNKALTKNVHLFQKLEMYWSLFWRRLLFTSSVLCHQKRPNLQIWVGVPMALSRIKWLNHRGFRTFSLKCVILSSTMNRKIITLDLDEKVSWTTKDQWQIHLNELKW